MDTVGRVYSLIEERNMSLFQLARMSEISYSTLSNSKRRAGQLSVETIERICVALGITLSEFFAEPERASHRLQFSRKKCWTSGCGYGKL